MNEEALVSNKAFLTLSPLDLFLEGGDKRELRKPQEKMLRRREDFWDGFSERERERREGFSTLLVDGHIKYIRTKGPICTATI